MTEVKGTRTVILVATSVPPTAGDTNISIYVNTADFAETADTEDLSTFSKTSKVYRGTLKDGTFSMGGVYDDGASNTPQTLFRGRKGDLFQIKIRPEGTGSGLPQDAFDAVLTNFTRNSPVTGHHMWTAEFQCSDDVDQTDQS